VGRCALSATYTVYTINGGNGNPVVCIVQYLYHIAIVGLNPLPGPCTSRVLWLLSLPVWRATSVLHASISLSFSHAPLISRSRSPGIHGCTATVGDDSGDERTIRRHTPTADDEGVVSFLARFGTGVLGVGTDPGDLGLLDGLCLVIVQFQVGGVGSLLKHVFATSEAVHTLTQ